MSLRAAWGGARRRPSKSKPTNAVKSTTVSAPNETTKSVPPSTGELGGSSPANTSVYSLTQELNGKRSLTGLVDKFKLFSQEASFRHHKGIYYATVIRLAGAGKAESVKEILEFQKQFNDISNEGFNARLIILYGKAKMYECARQVFDEMPQRNCERTSMSFNALLRACLNADMHDKMIQLFHQLPTEIGVEPDLVSYCTTMKALCDTRHFKLAISLLFKMEDIGWKANIACYNTLFGGLYSCKDFIQVDKIWNRMLENDVRPDVKSYTIRATAYALNRRGDVVLEIRDEMKKKGIMPDVVFFRALIKSFVVDNNLDEAKRLYKEARSKRCKLSVNSFEALIPLALEKGDFELVLEMIRDVFQLKFSINEAILQQVVERFCKESRLEEAREILRLGKDNDFCRYRLKMVP